MRSHHDHHREREEGQARLDRRCAHNPLQGELRPLRDPNDSAEQVFDLVAATV
jgi:hypothetical protein